MSTQNPPLSPVKKVISRVYSLAGQLNKRWVLGINLTCFAALTLIVCLRPEGPHYWDFFPDSYDYLEQSKNDFLSLDLYCPERGTRMARAFTVPLFYKLTGSDFENFVLFQSVFYCVCVLLFVSSLLTLIKRNYLKIPFILVLYFLFSWWNIVGWTNQTLSEHLSFCFLLLWLAVLLHFLTRRNTFSFILLLVITILHSFTRDTWPYLTVITAILLIAFYFKQERKFTLRYLFTYLMFSVVVFFIQQKTIDIGERYRLSVYNNVFARVAKNEEYLQWFRKKGLPLTGLLKSEFSHLNVMESNDQGRLYQTYTDSTYKPIFKWVTSKGKSAYMQFLMTHPSYFLLLHETKEERARIFCYNLTGYIGEAPDNFSLQKDILPVFNPWVVLALCVIIFWLYWKRKETSTAFILPLLMLVLTTANVFLSYNAEALEVERHMYYTTILIEIIGWVCVFVIADLVLDKYKERFKKYIAI